MIFGLVGYAGSGKDTAAEMLVSKGWKRLAFGDKVKECLYAMNPNVWDGAAEEWTEGPEPLRQLVDFYGWDEVKRWSEVRQLLQRLGTEMGRMVISDSLWINLLLQEVQKYRHSHNIVITDVRFPNEAQLVELLNGKLILIQREGVSPPNDHVSESLPKTVRPDFILKNNSDLPALQAGLDEILGSDLVKPYLIP